MLLCGPISLAPRPERHKERALFNKRRRSNQTSFLSLKKVGCGGGLLATALASKGARVTAIDASAGALRVAEQRAAEHGEAIERRGHVQRHGI